VEEKEQHPSCTAMRARIYDGSGGIEVTSEAITAGGLHHKAVKLKNRKNQRFPILTRVERYITSASSAAYQKNLKATPNITVPAVRNEASCNVAQPSSIIQISGGK